MFRIVAVVTLAGVCGGALGQSTSRIDAVSGDRQIAVNTNVPSKPFVVRALDAAGKPVSGAELFIAPAADPGLVYVQDEFKFRGFNTIGTVSYTAFGSPNPAYYAITDQNGLAQASGPYVDPPSSAFSVVARQLGASPTIRATFAVVALKTQPAGTPTVVVEYFNSDVSHYFITLLDEEVAALDAGAFQGWRRSIGAFVAYRMQEQAPLNAVPVCRFFSAQFTSHFYSADADECDAVVRKWPDVWALETRSAFFINVPDRTTGLCDAGYQPVFRLFNNSPSPNHRYVTDAALRDKMVAAGWIAEGYGPGATVFCTPA